MSETTASAKGTRGRRAIIAAVVLYFVFALEIVIMISPFAFLFYAAFNPFLLTLNQTALTRWLTAFFLPHMIVPPNGFLVAVRIAGSVLFLAGLLTFLVCAIQVYTGKLLKKSTQTKGLYTLIRHPQYLGLASAGLGLAIMWPRFLTLALFALMLLLYYWLAKDEERRMIHRYGENYASYQNSTGMFLPKFIEGRVRLGGKSGRHHADKWLTLTSSALLVLVIVGGGFALRAYTVHSLPLQQVEKVDVVAISGEDLSNASDLLSPVLADSGIASKLMVAQQHPGHRILAYYIPINYVMQGMIANTGDEWKLFEHHKTVGMITDFIFHPFRHLTGHHMQMMDMQHHDPKMHNSPEMKRRIIFLDVSAAGRSLNSPYDDFGINVKRTPLFFADIHIHTGEILQVKDTPAGSGWGTVPTPLF